MKAVVALAVLLFVGCVCAYSEAEYKSTFLGWMGEHGKVYSSEEFVRRYEIFRENMNYVRDWNAKGSSTVLGLTVFADLSNSEYRNIYLGTRIDASAELANAELSFPTTEAESLAAKVDWRDKGVVTLIKDQGQCGSCWSFSSTGSIEGAWALAKQKLVSLSEQNLMDCSYTYGNLACNGGLMPRAFSYVMANKGIATEESYPYTAKSSLTCHYKTATLGATISNYTTIAAGNEQDLAASLNKQPISVAIDASHNSFQLYKSGVYYESTCSSSRLDHGVLAVGYGTDDTTGKDYYIVKNSWGTVWGQAGYILMARNQGNNCGIATQASYPVV